MNNLMLYVGLPSRAKMQLWAHNMKVVYALFPEIVRRILLRIKELGR